MAEIVQSSFAKRLVFSEDSVQVGRRHPVKLLLRRNQRPGIVKPTFVLDVRADLSEEDRTNISKYKLGDVVLFEKYKMTDRGRGLLGFLSRIFFNAINLTISTRDLVGGKRIECKNVVEMLAMEDYLKEAAKTFGAILRAAQHFGGEEVVEL